jgi:dienelactone hydrolase
MKGYESRSFSAPLRSGRTVTHDIYQRGEGPPIVVIQELPGIGPETLRLADRLVSAGYQVTLPHLFGPLGRTSMVGNLVRVICMRREFDLLARDESSPVVDWLRALCRDVRDRTGAPGVGVIGMCLTGNFAISLMADDSVLAAVASQPSLPLFTQSALHMSADEVSQAKTRLDREGPMLAFRFDGDSMCDLKKFEAIDETFNDDGTERVKLDTLPGKGHSVLTIDFVDEEGHPTRAALQSVLDYFAQKLKR